MSSAESKLSGILGTLGLCGIIVASGIGSACMADGVPACPGRCFQFTLEMVEGSTHPYCVAVDGTQLEIPFTGSDPDGYHGRTCFNSSSVPHVVTAVDHLAGGGQLSDLPQEVRDAYLATVDQVTADIEAECITAAAGQCTNEAQVCSGIAGDAYEQLVVDQTCVLEVGGTEPIVLGPGQVCESVFAGTGGTGFDEHCTDSTGDGGADEGADSSTGVMADPFGDLDALVSCSPPTSCEVDRAFLSHISANYSIFADEQITLTLVDREAPCGPGAQLGGLDKAEHASALAEVFDFRNGDVIHKVDAVTIDGLDDAMEAVSSLLEDPSTTLVLRRPEGSGCDTLTYDIDVL